MKYESNQHLHQRKKLMEHNQILNKSSITKVQVRMLMDLNKLKFSRQGLVQFTLMKIRQIFLLVVKIVNRNYLNRHTRQASKLHYNKA